MEENDSLFPSKLLSDLRKAADAIIAAKSVLVITHIDADGISAGSIAETTLKRLEKEYEIRYEKKFTELLINEINNSSKDLVWICDLGSAYISSLTRNGIVITDHHVPDPNWRSGQSSLYSFGCKYLINPHQYGHDGSYEICGAGMTYFLSKTIDSKNEDLSFLGIAGALGDFQDEREKRLVSWNRVILVDAISSGNISIETGLRYYGREIRSLSQYLAYADSPRIPGLFDDKEASEEFLKNLDIEYELDEEPRMWCDLKDAEKQRIVQAISEKTGVSEKELQGEIYVYNKYAPKSGLHDLKEFSTVLNSCGRYDDAVTGARLCSGDLSAVQDAEKNRREHRKNISNALKFVKDNHLMRRRHLVQYFDAGNEIKDTVLGIIAGMAIDTNWVEPDLPMIAFANQEDGIKVSARAPKSFSEGKIDLSEVMRDAAQSVGGLGGGHSVAAGATIPFGTIEQFLDAAEAAIQEQSAKKKRKR